MAKRQTRRWILSRFSRTRKFWTTYQPSTAGKKKASTSVRTPPWEDWTPAKDRAPARRKQHQVTADKRNVGFILGQIRCGASNKQNRSNAIMPRSRVKRGRSRGKDRKW